MIWTGLKINKWTTILNQEKTTRTHNLGILEGQTCCKFSKDAMQDAAADELSSSQAQISIQCEENSEGQDGIVLFDTEDFPLVNIHCPTSAGDLPED